MKMKKIVLTLLLIAFFGAIKAQDSEVVIQAGSNRLVSILQTDGTKWVGYLLSMDAREVLFKTQEGRTLFIPQYVISKVILVKESEFSEKGKYIGEEKFCTRYFLTTNGLPLKKNTG